MSDDQSARWYFAFGSNMSSEVFIQSRGMRPASAEVARLSGYELVFDQKGLPLAEPAFASVQPRDKAEVWGVLYKMTPADFDRLHCTEGERYQSRSVEVIGSESGQVTAFAFIGSRSTPGLYPSRRYLRKIVNGAVEHRLPPDYIEYLKSFPTTYIPILSELAGLFIKCVLWYSSKGKVIRFGPVQLGARKAAEEKEEK